MRYCSECLQPDTRPNSYFSGTICPACVYVKSLDAVDFRSRELEIERFVDFGRKHASDGYDCVVGVSGGKDSTRQALYVRDHLGMNPLLVCVAPAPIMQSEIGIFNIANLNSLGFDIHHIFPAPETWRRLMRVSFDRYLNPFKSTELALFSGVPRVAIRKQIPLIWWGENSALQLGETGIMGDAGYDGNNLRKMNTLNGGEIQWMIDAGFDEDSLDFYRMPTEYEFQKNNIKTIFLGYFWKDWSLINNAKFSLARGLIKRQDPPIDIGDYEGVTALDEDWTAVNQMIKYYKFGFGRATDYANEDIRFGNLSRSEAADLVVKVDGKCASKYIKSLCDFINIDVGSFWDKVKREAVNRDLFEISDDGSIHPKFEVGVGLVR